MKRQQIVAGNWKMNKTYTEGVELAGAIARKLPAASTDALVILCTPYIHLSGIASTIKGVSNLKLGAQNCYQEESGAYTGEISPAMLRSVGCDYVILGHSERREYFGEKDDLLARKVDLALSHDLRPIFCCGEKLDIREAGTHEELVARQITEGLFHLSPDQFRKVVVAYEPVWAIGTGKTATPGQAQEMHHHIRNLIKKKYGAEIADATTILYGGSAKPSNARELFSQPDVDGGLIGGASLKADDFIAIAEGF